MVVLPDRVPWFVVGPGLGLLVVALFVLVNAPLGASGAYVQTADALRRRPGFMSWRVFYFVGMFAGGLLAAVLRGGPVLRWGYDSLRNVWPIGVVALLVFVGAIVMGYGARMAGGCTSGHGICGTSQRSAASWVTTATFMGVAIVVTLILRLVTGGAL